MFYMSIGLTRSLVERDQEDQSTASTVTSDYSWSCVRSCLFPERMADDIDFMHFFFLLKPITRSKGRNFNQSGKQGRKDECN